MYYMCVCSLHMFGFTGVQWLNKQKTKHGTRTGLKNLLKRSQRKTANTSESWRTVAQDQEN